MSNIENVILLHGGGLSYEVANQIINKLPPSINVRTISMSKSKDFQAALLGPDINNVNSNTTVAIFIVQTIENESPTEDAGACIRYFQRKTHPETLLTNKVQLFAVLGLGDSNLLLDRQHTSAKDCNQVAQKLDVRLEKLGGIRFCNRGECDERTGMLEVEPWIDMLVDKIKG